MPSRAHISNSQCEMHVVVQHYGVKHSAENLGSHLWPSPLGKPLPKSTGFICSVPKPLPESTGFIYSIPFGRHTQDGQKRGRGEMGGSADRGQCCRMDKAGEAGRRFHGSLPSTIPGVVSEPGAANEAVSNKIHIYNSSGPDLAETARDSGACPGISESTESNCNTSCSSCSCQEGVRHVLVTSQCVPHMVLPLRATPAAAVFRTR